MKALRAGDTLQRRRSKGRVSPQSHLILRKAGGLSRRMATCRNLTTASGVFVSEGSERKNAAAGGRRCAGS